MKDVQDRIAHASRPFEAVYSMIMISLLAQRLVYRTVVLGVLLYMGLRHGATLQEIHYQEV